MPQPYRDALPPEWFEKCARHVSPTVARTQQFGFYCDACARRLTEEAFNGRAPMYHGETVLGTCGLCNTRGAVTLRSWFVCGICWNVVVAYQKSLVASATIHEHWRQTITPHLPQLELFETEEIRVEPFKRKAKTKQQSAKSLTVLDFIVASVAPSDPPIPLFHIEQKTGPGSIDQMKEFQLDVNDYEDILGASTNTGLPAYIFHVQVGQEYENGTRRVVPRGLWWTDLVSLRKALIRVAGRRMEDKNAAYFSPTAFRAIDDFLPELLESRYRERGAELGLPTSHCPVARSSGIMQIQASRDFPREVPCHCALDQQIERVLSRKVLRQSPANLFESLPRRVMQTSQIGRINLGVAAELTEIRIDKR
jgi:hypothetical protein